MKKLIVITTILVAFGCVATDAQAGPLRRIVKKIVHRSQTQSATTGSCGANGSCATK